MKNNIEYHKIWIPYRSESDKFFDLIFMLAFLCPVIAGVIIMGFMAYCFLDGQFY